MLVVLVVGSGLGWICHQARVQREAVAAIEALGGRVYYGWEWDSATAQLKPDSQSPGWLRRQLGPGFFEEFASVYVCSGADDALMVHVGRLPHLERLGVYGTQVTDANLAHVAGLTHLKALNLFGSTVTDLEPLVHRFGAAAALNQLRIKP
jgi:hypothetical protein